ncbi:restriction endonuclease subunit S [Segatella bryantii]|uniref:restriction endonuclease subunit S n=1 Tax=Segatella bryantii TaxID=77095 RepID=UPI00285372D5|nr:restriction endonuclease subunit S [Segatella bryantii]MDR4931858.1 restriction endonuclease subunit S [Segatella bryantii]
MERIMKDSGLPWIKDIPSYWRVMPNKYVMNKVKEIQDIYKDEDIISLSIDGVKVRDLDAGGKMPTSFDGYQRIKPNRLLMCLFDIDVTPRCIGLIKDEGLTSPAYSQFVMREKGYAPYYYYYYLSLDFDKTLVHLAKNLRHSLTEDQLGAINVVVPPYIEQKAIADYLDKKTSEIDAAIKEAQELIEKYKAYKQSIITEIVTKGLNPNVTMKDSGVEWIGEIPEHWGYTRIDTLFTEGVQKNIFYEFDHALKFTYGALVPKNEEGDVSELKGTYLAYSIIEEDDIAINGLNLNFDFVSQRVARSPERGILTSAYLILKPKDRRYSRYFTYQLKSWDNQKVFHGMGKGVRLTLSFAEVKKMLMPVPPLKEQMAIADYLDDKCAKIDSIIADKETLISRLQEYKKSIIFEYVTGKKEVPNG